MRESRGKQGFASEAAQNPAQLAHETGDFPPDLVEVVEGWPHLDGYRTPRDSTASCARSASRSFRDSIGVDREPRRAHSAYHNPGCRCNGFPRRRYGAESTETGSNGTTNVADMLNRGRTCSSADDSFRCVSRKYRMNQIFPPHCEVRVMAENRPRGQPTDRFNCRGTGPSNLPFHAVPIQKEHAMAKNMFAIGMTNLALSLITASAFSAGPTDGIRPTPSANHHVTPGLDSRNADLGTITIDTDFESGCLDRAVKLGENWYHLCLRPDTWYGFYFRIRGCKNKDIIFQLTCGADNAPAGYEDGKGTWDRGNGVYHKPVVSYDRKTWRRIE